MPSKRWPGAIAIPLVALGVGARVELEATSANRLAFGLALVTGLGSGVLWQWLDRRDVVARLGFPAIAALASLGLFVALGVGTISAAGIASGACMAAGLVLTELWWRRQDDKATAAARHTVSQV